MSFKAILRQINALNVLLLAVIIALAAYILPPLLEINVAYTLPAPKKVTEEKEEQPAVAQPPSVMEYTVIAEQNVFNPERKIPTEKKDEQPLPKPEFVLYGTLIAGDASLAFMEDVKSPVTTQGRGKRQKTLRLGAALSGYTLGEVHHERVVMVRGDERIEVRIADQKHKKREGEAAATQPLQTGAAPVVRQRAQPQAQQPAAGAPSTAFTPQATPQVQPPARRLPASPSGR